MSERKQVPSLLQGHKGRDHQREKDCPCVKPVDAVHHCSHACMHAICRASSASKWCATISVLKSGCNQMEKPATGPDCNRSGLDRSCQLQRNPPSPVAGCRVSLCHTKLVVTGCHCKVVYIC